MEETAHSFSQLTSVNSLCIPPLFLLTRWAHLTPYFHFDRFPSHYDNPNGTFDLLVQVRKWRQEINAQQRALDRQKRGIEAEELKAKKMVKQMAKKGDIRTCKILAKELVRSRRQKDRIVTSKAQLNSISMQLQHQLCKFEVLVQRHGLGIVPLTCCCNFKDGSFYSWLTHFLFLLLRLAYSYTKDCRYAAEELRGHGHGQQPSQAPRDLCPDAGNVKGDDEGTQHSLVYSVPRFARTVDVIGQCVIIDLVFIDN